MATRCSPPLPAAWLLGLTACAEWPRFRHLPAGDSAIAVGEQPQPGDSGPALMDVEWDQAAAEVEPNDDLGAAAPIGEWVAGHHASMFREEVLRANASVSGHLDMRHLERRFGEHQRAEADHGYALWAVWVLERWLRQAKVNAEPQLSRA